jgi:hypothetical protein
LFFDLSGSTGIGTASLPSILQSVRVVLPRRVAAALMAAHRRANIMIGLAALMGANLRQRTTSIRLAGIIRLATQMPNRQG